MDHDLEGSKPFTEAVIMIKFETFNIIIFESLASIFLKTYDTLCVYLQEKIKVLKY